MKRRTGFYSVILTSVVCMLGGSAFAASSVYTLPGKICQCIQKPAGK